MPGVCGSRSLKNKNMFIPAAAIDGKTKVVKHNQTAYDIVKYLLIAEKQSRFIYPILAAYFNSDNKYNTLHNIWLYAKKNIIYAPESAENQTVRTVQRIIKDKNFQSGDCKHMATFCVSSAKACGIEAFFRLVSFRQENKTPTHVYCVAKVGGRLVYLDAVLNEFDIQPPNIKHFEDYKPIN